MTIELNNLSKVGADGTLFLCFNVPCGSLPETTVHRCSVKPGTDIEVYMQRVSDGLESVGKGRVPDDVIAQIQAVANEAWTPEVIAAYQAAQEQQ